MTGLKLPAPETGGIVILVSGWRQVGKTTLLQAVRAAALERGLSVGGFLSVARYVAGKKDGIDLLDAATGAVLPLATYQDQTHAASEIIVTGHYVFNPDALETGLRYAEAGQTADIYLVDELGPLELKRGEGWAAVIPLVRARRFGVAFVTVRPELVNAAREQIALEPDSPVLDVDADNRDALTAQVVGWVQQRRARQE